MERTNTTVMGRDAAELGGGNWHYLRAPMEDEADEDPYDENDELREDENY